jgi:hypothetical protein
MSLGELIDKFMLPGAESGGNADSGVEGNAAAERRAEADAELGGSASQATGRVGLREDMPTGANDESEGDRLCAYLAQYQLLDQVRSWPWLGGMRLSAPGLFQRCRPPSRPSPAKPL